ncbi:MAG: hypothetical protein KAH38_04430 [Candidatus Hydrogenedentes bacterium]|nr:hypothetical protein [Candidatus Hydrogenedentota bacterium]
MSRQTVQEKVVEQSVIDSCLACAVAEGDIVNFRFLFMPSSPLRQDSQEEIDSPKYAYLLPEDTSGPYYQEALRLVQRSETTRYIGAELAKKGPPQLPWELVMILADNAVRIGKYTAAAQAYELLRIRRRMQELMLDKADALLEQGNTEAAAYGYLVASGLDYDYAAFPEPLPAVPNYQERALRLHSVYQDDPKKNIAMQPDETLLKTALDYLLFSPEFSQRLHDLSETAKVSFVSLLVQRMDSEWDVFAARYRQATQIVIRHRALLDQVNTYSPEALGLLFEQLLDSDQMEELKEIPSILLGESVKDWDWWQCMKTLSYHHPAAALMVSRQRLSAKEEILIPVCHPDSKLARELNLFS